MSVFDWTILIFLVLLIGVAAVIDWFLKKVSPPSFDQAKAIQLAKSVKWHEEAKRTALYMPPREIPARSIYLGIHEPGLIEKPFLSDSGVYISGNKVSIDLSVLSGHIAIFGSTGYGKTELEKRLLYELFSKTDLNVHLLDLKGNEDLTRSFCSMAYMFGRGNAKVFRMGQRRIGYPFDGFRGSTEAMKNKLVTLTDIQKLEGNGLWWGKMKRMVINWVVDAPDGPPRDLDELMFRLTKKWFTDTYGKGSQFENDHTVQERVSLMVRKMGNDPSPVENVALDFYSISDELKKYVKRDGFAIEHTRAINFSIKLSTASFIGGYTTEFIFTDYLDAMENRIDRPTVLMIDEAALLPGTNLEAILTLGRQAGVKVIFATQSFASLGDKLDQERILSNCNTQIFFKLLFPEYAADISGTTQQPETSYQSEQGIHTGVTSTRFQAQFAIKPDEVRALPKGQCFIYRDSGNARVAIEMIPELPAPPPEEIYIPKVTPPSPVLPVNHPIP